MKEKFDIWGGENKALLLACICSIGMYDFFAFREFALGGLSVPYTLCIQILKGLSTYYVSRQRGGRG